MKKVSIGNDIISLKKTNAEKSQELNFYTKFISEKEISLYKKGYFSPLNFHQFVWLCWSVKEAVYKFQKRLNHETVFSPKKITITKNISPQKSNSSFFDENQIEKHAFNKEECFCCTAILDKNIFQTRSIISSEIIFTIAAEETLFDEIFWGIKQIDDENYEAQTSAVQTFALSQLKNVLPKKNLQLEKHSAGFPFLKSQEQVLISFSHDYNFISYTFFIAENFNRNKE